MTPPTLPTILARLAVLVPGRVRLGQQFSDGVQTISVYDDTWSDQGGWLQVYTVDPAHDAGGVQYDRSWRDTRAALEQEIESRPGWDWASGTVPVAPGGYDATVWTEGHWRDNTHVAHADSPTLALALALLAALA